MTDWDPEAEEWERLANEWLCRTLLDAADGAGTEEGEELWAQYSGLLGCLGYTDVVAWCHGEYV